MGPLAIEEDLPEFTKVLVQNYDKALLFCTILSG